MGLNNSPNFFQQKMPELMVGLEFVRACIDDVAVKSSDSWEDHVRKIDLALTRLSEAGLKVDAAKSHFGLGKAEHIICWKKGN
jgi:hypothetical protein